ncbi:NAD(P)H-hydrate dehydratase [bacterium]|nr:NAD(P)H-hydrate dehydratase [bacterium]
MKVVSFNQMKEIDRIAIEECGIKGLFLMENAGCAVGKNAEEMLAGIERNAQVLIVCGKGNNGGDGFVAARHLLNSGCVKDIDIKVALLGNIKDIKGDAKTNFDIIKEMGADIFEILELKQLQKAKHIFQHAGLVIDAIFGIGLKGTVRGVALEVIKLINMLKQSQVLSVDLPSGLYECFDEKRDVCIQADRTITFGLPKKELLIYPGIKFTGNLIIQDIGLPKKLLTDPKLKLNLTTHSELSSLISNRPINSHKGTFGHVFIIAGSRGLTGAAALAGLGALYSGTGLVTLGIPESLNSIMEMKLTEVMTKPLAETTDGSLSKKAKKEILDFSARVDAVAIGPGLSRNTETSFLIRELIESLEKPVVIDADGINALAGHVSMLKKRRYPTIITPHLAEMAKLIEGDVSEVTSGRIGIAEKFAYTYKTITLLKGARTIIADEKGNIYINPTGNPALAIGGTGDVLTGLISGLIAQGLFGLDAAKLGAYLHGLAADIWKYENKLDRCLTATELTKYIPKAFMSAKN